MLLRPGTRLRPIGRVRGMSGATAAWDANSLPGLLADYDAANVVGVSDGALASTVPEPVGGFDLVQAGASRATYQLTGGPNGGPSLRFSGAQMYPIPAGLSVGTQSLTVYTVMRQRQMSNNVEIRFGTGGAYLIITQVSKATEIYNSAGGSFSSGHYAPQGTDPYRWEIRTSAFSASESRVRCVVGPSTFDSAGSALTSQTLTGGDFGSYGAGFYSIKDFARVLIYGQAHDAGQMAEVEAGLSSLYGLPRPFPTSADTLVAHGNSWAYGWLSEADGGYVLPTATALGVSCLNYGYPGLTTAQMASEAAAVVDVRYVAGRALVVQELINDINGNAGTAAQIYATHKAYLEARTAAGWKVVFINCPACSAFDAAKQTKADAVNALFAADFSTATADANVFLPTGGVTYADAMVSISAMVPAGDGLHPTDAQYATVAARLQVALGLI